MTNLLELNVAMKTLQKLNQDRQVMRWINEYAILRVGQAVEEHQIASELIDGMRRAQLFPSDQRARIQDLGSILWGGGHTNQRCTSDGEKSQQK